MGFSKKDTLMIKGVAILMMYFHHNFLRLSRFDMYTIISDPFSDNTIVNIAKFCKICVALFVFLSAYAMTIKYKSISGDFKFSLKDVREVSTKRYFSLMFGYWFIFISTSIIAFFFDRTRQLKAYGEGIDAAVRFVFDFLGIAETVGTGSYVHTWWYVGFAIVLIFIMPLLLGLYSKIGFMLVPLSILFPSIMRWDMTSDFIRWMFTIALGIWCADQNILAKVKEFKICKNIYISGFIKMALELVVLYSVYMVRKSEVGTHHLALMDGLGALIIILLSFEFVSLIKPLKTLLCYFGEHSMNMFLVHSLFRAFWFDEFIYAPQYFWLIMINLVVVTIITSVAIEKAKKFMRYNQLEAKVIEKVNNL